tara:strand:+ start:221 stop:370 length:150 start_codon:yes stop_codon:yes gene_type:complete
LKRIPSGARFNIFEQQKMVKEAKEVVNGTTVRCAASQHQTAVKGIALDR